MFQFGMLFFICPVDKNLNWNIVCWQHQNCWALTNVECNWHSNSWVLSISLPFEKPWLEGFYEIDSLQMLSVRRLGKVTTRWKSWTFHNLGYRKQGQGAFEKIQPLKIRSQEKIWIAYHLCWKNLCYLHQRNAWIVDSCLQSFLPYCLLSGSRFPCCVLLALSWNTKMKIQVQISWVGQSTNMSDTC